MSKSFNIVPKYIPSFFSNLLSTPNIFTEKPFISKYLYIKSSSPIKSISCFDLLQPNE